MNKPLFLLPCILVYKLAYLIAKTPLIIIRYFCLGFFFSILTIINILVFTISKITKWFFFGIAFSLKIIFYDMIFGFLKFIFKLIKTIYMYILKLISLFLKGIVMTSYIVYKLLFKKIVTNTLYIVRLFLKGISTTSILIYVGLVMLLGLFRKLSYLLYKAVKYLLFAIVYPIIFIYIFVGKIIESIRMRNQSIKIKNEIKREAKIRKRQEIIETKKRQREKNEYINKNVEIKRKKLSEYINDFLGFLVSLPKKIRTGIKDWYKSLSIVKNIANKKNVETQALLINFEGEDAKKSDTKVVYEYVAKNSEGKVIKGYFEAFSKVEVHSYLLSEGFEVYSIRTSRAIKLFHKNASGNNTKIKTKDLIFFLTQLSTYIKAGIPLVESLKILSRQYKNKSYQRIFKSLIYDLTMGENFSDALSKQGIAFPRLLINMVKASELTGELPEALDDMADYYTETDKTRKQMITALTYPTIVFVIAIAVITFILLFVIPQFVDIYNSMDNSRVPEFTKVVLDVSNFLQGNAIYLFIGFVIVVLIFAYLYKNVKLFKTFIQWFMMHLPVVGNILIYNEVTMFTKTFCSLLSHNVFITDSMEILNKITNNEIYKMIILDTINNLARGEKISLAFKHWAFPIPAYEMIVTGEKTGQLPEMMGKVSGYYQELHRNAVTRIKSFIEPILIIFLTFTVGIIVLSIIIPMFDMYSSVQQQ